MSATTKCNRYYRSISTSAAPHCDGGCSGDGEQKLSSIQHQKGQTSCTPLSPSGSCRSAALELVLETNRVGVTHLREERPHEAVKVFFNALSMCRSLLASEEEELPLDATTSSFITPEISHREVGSFHRSSPLSSLSFYREGLDLSLASNTQGRDACLANNSVDGMLLSAVLTFNTSLAMNLVALESTASPAKALAALGKAQNLYELSLDLWKQILLSCSSEERESMPASTSMKSDAHLMAMITLNNMGCLVAEQQQQYPLFASTTTTQDFFWSILTSSSPEDDDRCDRIEYHSVDAIKGIIFANASLVLFGMLSGQCAPCA